MSSAARTVSAFIGKVAAACRLIPSGTRASASAATTTNSACAPPPGAQGETAAITRSPGAHSAAAPGPATSTTPARSMPGT